MWILLDACTEYYSNSYLLHICSAMLFFMRIQGIGENACAKKSHEKYLIALKGSGLAFPEDKLACGMEEQGAGTSTLAIQGLCRNKLRDNTSLY